MNLNKGINVIEGQGLLTFTGVGTNRVGIMGNFYKGPVNKATLVTNRAQFERTFGDKPAPGTDSYYSILAFFASAGSAPLYITRIASSSAAKSSLTVQDRQGTPADTLKIEALSEGVHGDLISVEVADHNTLTTKVTADVGSGATSASLQSIGGIEVGSYVEFDNGTQQEQVQVTGINIANKQITWSGGLTNGYTVALTTVKSLEFKISVYLSNNLVEEWPGLSMVDDVSFHVEKIINDVSEHITVTDMKASDAGLTDRPAVTSKTALSSGADGLSDVAGSDYEGSQANKTGLYAFDEVENLFRIGCPNPKLTDADAVAAYKSLVQAMLDYADNRNTLEVYADIPYNTTVANAVTFASAYEGRRLALWYPWGGINTATGIKYIPVSGGVLGASVAKDAQRGVAKSIGNEPLGMFISLEKQLTIDESETLNEAGINTVEVKNGIRTWGGRTQSADSRWIFVDQSEYWNYQAETMLARLQSFAFELNNPATRARMKFAIEKFEQDEQRTGAITDFGVVCDESNNPQSQVANGIMKVDVWYVKAGTAEKIWINLTHSPAGAPSLAS